MSNHLTPTDPSPLEFASTLSCWSGPVSPRPLSGGITNTNFVVVDGGAKYVVRIGTDLALHGVDRSHEVATCRAAHACGLAPEIVHSEPGALVVVYVDAETLTAKDVRRPATLVRIVEMIRRCHRDMPLHLDGATLMFWPFQVCRNYLAAARRGACRIEPRLARLAEVNDDLEHRVGAIQPTFCHNDLLAANFLDSGSRLWLIDWEYAGWNTPLFDLANLASNAQLQAQQRVDLLEMYYGHSIDGELLARFDAVQCVSLLRESLWSTVQEQHSTLDVDYVSYTDEYLGRLDTAYDALVAR